MVLLDGEDLAERIGAAVKNAPVRLGIDSFGGQATNRMASCLEPGATLVIYGAMSGEVAAIAPGTIVFKDLRGPRTVAIQTSSKRTTRCDRRSLSRVGRTFCRWWTGRQDRFHLSSRRHPGRGTKGVATRHRRQGHGHVQLTRREAPWTAWRSARFGQTALFSNISQWVMIYCSSVCTVFRITLRHQLKYFSTLGYRVVAPFMCGYEPTETTTDATFYSADLAHDVVELVRALGAKRATLLGHDWGAYAAYAAAVLAPDLYDCIVTLAVPYGPGFRSALVASAGIVPAFK